MSLDPIVINVPTPLSPQKIPRFKFLANSAKSTKIITAVAAIVIGLSMVSFTIFTVVGNNNNFKKEHGITTPGQEEVPDQSSGTEKSADALPGGGVAVGTGGTTGTNSPVVTLTAEPKSVSIGATVKLKWSVTNNPKSCVASEDWSGDKNTTSGEETTPPLAKSQAYLYTLTCKTATGTGFSTVSVSAASQITIGDAAKSPAVSIAAIPANPYVGQTTTITWSATNNPTSCVASGDWSGNKPSAGSFETPVLTAARDYTFELKCSNTAGSGSLTAHATAIPPPPNVPVVGLSSDPTGPVTPGTPVSLTWEFVGGDAATSCTASGDWSGAKAPGGGTASVGALSSIKTYTFTITCSNSSGSTNDTASVIVIPNPPAVSLTVSPSSMFVGNASTLSWNATNSPTSCTASGDWSGAKAASGSASTGTLNTAKTYTYSLSCSNAGGTGFANNVPLNVTLPPSPVVSISANPITFTAGGSSTLSWNATNSPTSCTASGDWSGAKAASGTASTGTLSTVKTYTYSLSCSNAGGSNSSSASVDVTSGGTPVVAPVVTISVNPTSIGTGSQSTINWSATNNPTSCTASGSWSGAKSSSGSTSTGVQATAGTKTFTLVCSNSAGSDTKSASLTVIAIPVVSISVNPTSITAGSSSNISWSATNSPTTCTAGGSWSGSKAASGGPLTTGAMNTAGSFIYSLSCTNSGGTGSNSATLTVTSAAPVYCGGSSPCYGQSEMASRAVSGNCWGWNDPGNGTVPWVINITAFRPKHPGGTSQGSLESPSSTCNRNIFAILGGGTISGYRDGGGGTTHNHTSSTKNNTSGSGLASGTYHVGYYDPAKP